MNRNIIFFSGFSAFLAIFYMIFGGQKSVKKTVLEPLNPEQHARNEAKKLLSEATTKELASEMGKRGGGRPRKKKDVTDE